MRVLAFITDIDVAEQVLASASGVYSISKLRGCMGYRAVVLASVFMNANPAKILVIHHAPPDGGPTKEFDVPGSLEWDDETFTVKRATGAVLCQVATRSAHQSIDVADLFAPEAQISLSLPDGPDLEIEVVRKHRAAALAAVGELVRAAVAVDADFRQSLEATGTRQLKRGVGCLATSVVGVAVGGGLVWFGAGSHDFAYFALFCFAIGLLVGPWIIYGGLRSRRLVRDSRGVSL